MADKGEGEVSHVVMDERGVGGGGWMSVFL